MADSGSLERFAFPEGFATWWSTTYPVPASSIDEYGHMTAVHYPVAFETAAATFLTHTLEKTPPASVVADLHVVYRHEVLLDFSPAIVHIRPTHVGSTSLTLQMVLVDSRATPCAQADIRYVMWDVAAHRKQRMSEEMRTALSAYAPDRT